MLSIKMATIAVCLVRPAPSLLAPSAYPPIMMHPDSPGVGVTKALFINFSLMGIIDFAKE